MTSPHDMTPEERERFDAVAAKVGAAYAAMNAATERLLATGGPAAVAEAAWIPGGPSVQEIIAICERLPGEAAGAAE